MRGVVKMFKSERGYGFIERDQQSDLFFHVKSIVSPTLPQPGELVEFDIGRDERSGKDHAVGVRVV